MKGYQMKTKADYLREATPGTIVAFSLKEKVLSGKIIDMVEGPAPYVIETKNKSVFYLTPDRIMWVKTGDKWPAGIYNALKLSVTK